MTALYGLHVLDSLHSNGCQERNEGGPINRAKRKKSGRENYESEATNRCSIANRASSNRVETPVFSKIFERCRFTVSSLS